jgi:acyl transferase domain-containing protein
MFIGLDRGHMLSPTGQCKAFDASADGYARGEGCGLFVLKRLSDARAENDKILGVIRGIEVNQSGLAHSITHPHHATQKALFDQLLERSGLEAHRVNVIEAHGTGTRAGDPTEVASIRNVFSIQRKSSNPLYLTSIKANIGHLEAASGAAGLAKLLLMLHYRIIPRQISLQHLNPDIAALEIDHTIIPTTHVPWTPSHNGMTRVALLNNFGAAGSNTALLLEEYLSPACTSPEPRGMPYVFGFSAKTEGALAELRTKYLQWLQHSANEAVRLSDIAYTMTARRQLYSYRLAVTARDKTELIHKLSRGQVAQPILRSSKVAFVFSGQGGQYFGMGQTLYRTCPRFQHDLDQCHRILIASGFPGVLQVINPDSPDSGLSKQEALEAHQAAIFSLQYALARLWMAWGLTPAVVVGHR